jgi:CheY-like chemotaxis protein
MMKKILIVDDQPTMRQILRLALWNKFEIQEAGDAYAANEMIKLSRPDAIVLDVMMPGDMDGYQLCEKIKQDPKLASIYIALVTACGQVEDQERGMALGANAYFVKPFSPLELLRHLSAALLTEPTGRD